MRKQIVQRLSDERSACKSIMEAVIRLSLPRRKLGRGTGRVIGSRTAQISYVEAIYEDHRHQPPTNRQRVAARVHMAEVDDWDSK